MRPLSPSALLSVVRATHNCLPRLEPDFRSRFLELVVERGGGERVGAGFVPRWLYEMHWAAAAMSPFERVDEDTLVLADAKDVDAKLLRFAQSGREDGWLRGWRDETYQVFSLDARREPLFRIERAFARRIGCLRRSIHVNGFAAGGSKYWLAQRSATKPRYPLHWDQIVAGGLPADIAPLACAVKECAEEAGLPSDACAAHLRSAGALTRVCESDGYMDIEEIAVFDLDLDRVGRNPQPFDGEVAGFALVDLDVLLSPADASRKYKPDVIMVLIDYLMRHGRIDVDEAGGSPYLELVRALHRPLPRCVASSLVRVGDADVDGLA